MNKREKIVILIVGGIAGLFMMRTVYRSYMGKLDRQHTDIRSLQQRLGVVEAERRTAQEGQDNWLKIGAQTFSMDPNEATRHLRGEMYELTKKAGLSNEKIDVMPAVLFGRHAVKVLPCSVIAEGDAKQIVHFLFELYRQPYLVRCKSLNLAQLGGKDVKKGMLKMTARLETPILPPNTKVSAVVPAKLEKERKPVERTEFPQLAAYDPIINKKMFEPYSPPLPGKASSPIPANQARDIPANQLVNLTWQPGENAKSHQIYWGTNPPGESVGTQANASLGRGGLSPGTTYYWRIDEINDGGTTTGDVWSFTTQQMTKPPDQPNTTTVVVPLPPTDGNMILISVLSSARAQQAVLVPQGQEAAPDAPCKRVEVGEQMFGGTLVLVHPRGAVTELNGATRFHPVGVMLLQNQPLSEEQHPEVYHEFKKLEARSAGISAGLPRN